MSDLVERLRNTQWYVQDGQLSDMVRGSNSTPREAADRIEALQRQLDIVPVAPTAADIEWAERSMLEARIEQLEAALREIATPRQFTEEGLFEQLHQELLHNQRTAKRALEGQS